MNDSPEYQDERKVHEPEIIQPGPGWKKREFNHTSGGSNYTRATWLYSSTSSDGCIAAIITFTLFLVSTSSFGILAGIGFLFYHIILAIIGSIAATRKLMRGQPFHLWSWRICNWVISFSLIFWQSGGTANGI